MTKWTTFRGEQWCQRVLFHVAFSCCCASRPIAHINFGLNRIPGRFLKVYNASETLGSYQEWFIIISFAHNYTENALTYLFPNVLSQLRNTQTMGLTELNYISEKINQCLLLETKLRKKIIVFVLWRTN